MDFRQTIQARAATLRQLPMNLPSAESMNDQVISPNIKPTLPRPTKPKPATRSTGSRTNYTEVSPELPIKFAPQVKEKPDKKQLPVPQGEVVLAAGNSNNKKPTPPMRTSSYIHDPIQDNTTTELTEEEEEDAYDDIGTYQIQAIIEKSRNMRSDGSGPPPLPPPNNTSPSRSSGMKRAFSSEKINRIHPETRHSTFSTHCNSSTLPDKRMLRRKQIPDMQLTPKSKSYEMIGDPMELVEFVKKYQFRFPIQMKMCSFHDGPISVKEGDIYNVHFLKNTEVVYLTARGGAQYTVPLNSAIEFGVLYNPTNNFQNAMQGFLFSSVSEIMTTGLVPPVMYAQQTCDTSSQDGSVQAGDVLIVHEVKKPKLTWNKVLSCTDVRTEKKKRLAEACSGNFSTTPSQVKLFLPQLLRYIPLPQYCVLFYSGKNAHEITSKLPRDTVEVTRKTTQQSIVVSKHMSNELFEFPLASNIIVQAIQPSESVSQQLMEDTKEKYEVFNPVSINSKTMMLPFDNPYTLNKQITLLSCVREDNNAFVGIQLVAPKNLPGHSAPLPIVPSQVSKDRGMQVQEDENDDYQLPEAAFGDSNKPGKPKQIDNSHYASPKSNKPIAPTNDEDVYDIPCTPKANNGVSKATLHLAQTSKSSLQLKKEIKAATQHSTAPALTTENSLTQKEVNDLKNEIRFLRTTVEKHDELFKTFSDKLGMQFFYFSITLLLAHFVF